MATNSIHIDASPQAVFDILADADRYPDWVMGAKRIRYADPQWPKPGSTFAHAVGAGPIEVKDTTTVLEVQEPTRLVLRARARPLGIAHVAISLTPEDGGTVVKMEEHPVSPTIARCLGPLFDPMIAPRNAASLRRLKHLAEDQSH
ncbi:MAG TPA: SRPBCC family protein [Acidimicrobiales bacterium]|nr:SRPBCC family protein [Acidimicrobiales bacterium]